MIALVGDYSAHVPAHRAIPRALELAVAATGREATWRWIHINEVRNASVDLAESAAVWLVPASPYANMAGALNAIVGLAKLDDRFSEPAVVSSTR